MKPPQIWRWGGDSLSAARPVPPPGVPEDSRARGCGLAGFAATGEVAVAGEEVERNGRFGGFFGGFSEGREGMACRT